MFSKKPEPSFPSAAPRPGPDPWLTAPRPSRCSAPMSRSRQCRRLGRPPRRRLGRRRHRLHLAGPGRTEPHRGCDHRRNARALRHCQGHDHGARAGRPQDRADRRRRALRDADDRAGRQRQRPLRARRGQGRQAARRGQPAAKPQRRARPRQGRRAAADARQPSSRRTNERADPQAPAFFGRGSAGVSPASAARLAASQASASASCAASTGSLRRASRLARSSRSARRDRRGSRPRLPRLLRCTGALAALATAASSSRCEHRPSVTGSFDWMFGMFQWVRSRIALIVLRVVPISLPICASEMSGWSRMIQAMPSGLSCRFETGV